MYTPILKITNLSKSFDNNNFVIRDLHVSINKGEFAVVMGNSGSGKSTLLFLLSGLDSLNAGSIYLNDIPIHGRTEKDLALLRRNTIGFVFQDSNLIPGLTVLENILVAGYLSPRPRKEINKNAASLLHELDIAPLADKYPSEISGGEMQRAAIARAMINNPVVLLADEPTGNLNSQAANKVLDCFSELSRRGQTIIMVTHDLKSACRGDRILFMKDGSLDEEFVFGQIDHRLPKLQELPIWLQQRGW